ncbi:MAG: hypothetical protein ACIALR_05060, partial [Blastopirellula sp. JB062]
MSKIKILSIGHSYCVAMNRAILRKIAEDSEFEVTVGGPAFFHGDLRPIEFEPEPEGSNLRTVPIPTRLSQRIHLFWYHRSSLRKLIRNSPYDIIYSWEEPYIYSGYQVSRICQNLNTPFCFFTFQNINKRYLLPFGWFEKSVLKQS